MPDAIMREDGVTGSANGCGHVHPSEPVTRPSPCPPICPPLHAWDGRQAARSIGTGSSETGVVECHGLGGDATASCLRSVI